jgi:GMP synthase (glutamine-hydrolysing)
MSEPRALLVALRDRSDPMLDHEWRCFAERSGLPLDHLSVHCMVDGRPDRGTLLRHDAIFFGGSGAYSVLDDVSWIREALEVLQEVVALQVPSWASCFGFQGLSVALGGEVVYDESRAEMGSTRLALTAAGQADPVLSVLPEQFWAQEGHHDRVVQIPRGVTLLATGTVIAEQAFKVDGAPFYASQFHPELTVEHTLARFRHYRDQYIGDRGDDLLEQLETGEDTPEMGQVLRRLVRMGR